MCINGVGKYMNIHVHEHTCTYGAHVRGIKDDGIETSVLILKVVH